MTKIVAYFEVLPGGAGDIPGPRLGVPEGSTDSLGVLVNLWLSRRSLGRSVRWVCGHGLGVHGVTQDEIRAIIHVIGIYCGVPQALECFRVARKVLEEA